MKKVSIIGAVLLVLVGGAFTWAWSLPRLAVRRLQAAVEADDQAAIAAMVDRQTLYDTLFERYKAQVVADADKLASQGQDAQPFAVLLSAEMVGPMSEGLSTAAGVREMLNTGKSPEEAFAGSIAGMSGQPGVPGPRGPAKWEAAYDGWGDIHLTLRSAGQKKPLLVLLRAMSFGHWMLVDVKN